MFRNTLTVAAAAAIALGFSVGAGAYSTYARWSSNYVTFFINPVSAEVDAASVESSLINGMEVWNTQSGTPLTVQYGGRVNDTSTGNDGRNVVIFRNSGDGSAIASTYSWWSGSTLIDSDIIFWDGPFTFFGGASGCGGSNAAYITDIAAHEFGHAIGLNHSTVGDATMYPGYSTCSQIQRTLAADDVAGAQALYSAAAPTNTAPSVTIVSPGATSSVLEGTVLQFSGSASDTQDGGLTAGLTWSSNLSGQIGVGGSFSRTLVRGTHTITASVTDTSGLRTTKQVTVTVTAPQAPSLTAKGSKQRTQQKVDLKWSGLSATSIDVYRDGVVVMPATSNDGSAQDVINRKGAATYLYVVCASGTTSCSNTAKVVFN